MRPPPHLRPATRKWWKDVISTWVLNEHHVKLLTRAAEAWDRGEEAREIIAAKGMTYEDRFGQPCPRPEIAIERDSALRYARLLRELDLDLDEPTASKRPPALRHNRTVSALRGGKYGT
jgi:hypothetical protein